MNTVRDRLFVALDVPRAKAPDLLSQVAHKVGGVKVNSLFIDFPGIVDMILAFGLRVFLDLKFHDIPNTVRAYAAAAARMGVFIFDVHCSGGEDMMRAAVDGVNDMEQTGHLQFRPLGIGITVLTSLDLDKLKAIGLVPSASTLEQTVLDMSRRAQDCGINGVVSSPRETAAIRKACGPDFVIINPGIRLAGSAKADQVRVDTPEKAMADGANFLVAGRPIIDQADPAATADRIVREMERGWYMRINR